MMRKVAPHYKSNSTYIAQRFSTAAKVGIGQKYSNKSVALIINHLDIEKNKTIAIFQN